MSKGLNLRDGAYLGLTHVFNDHFHFKNTGLWTTTATDSGDATVGTLPGGIVVISPSDGTVADNDETYLLSPAVFKIADGKPFAMGARVQFTEAATSAANVFVGLMSAVAANALVDDGGGPKASFSGAGFYKIDGGLNWNVIYSDGATQTKAELTATNTVNKTAAVAGSASAYQLLEVEIIPKSSTLCDVIFKINDSVVYKMMERTYASAAAASVAFGVKNGSAVQQPLNVDAVYGHQKV